MTQMAANPVQAPASAGGKKPSQEDMGATNTMRTAASIND